MHLSQKRLLQFFDISIALKGIDGVLEVIGGVLVLLLSPAQMGGFASFITHTELSEDPHNFLANIILKTLTHISPHAKLVSAIFLLGHGLVKIFLVWQLFRGRLWAYPLAIVIILCFIVFQIIQIVHGHSLLLVGLTMLDAIIVVLAWQEYNVKKAHELHS